MINLIVWLILGGVIGWLASIVMRTDGQQGIVLNVIVGIVGAFISGFIFNHDMNNNGLLTRRRCSRRSSERSSC